ncbi:hypothetical protein HPB52_019085 [Rhipicephalus sanguineus]|uniref:C2H2-type domain-containing protein n=1 Tax=Rhipicephalus sanguineus TaxID=34632 RepID=A0A9D4T486_RHISA|nr:hypothetical protein HPB52_019085 [Rhipicephalus sanguineus]
MEQQQRADDPCTGEEEHPCICCELVFPTAERLAVHAKVHRGGPRRPFKCTECCRRFLRTEKLRAHQLVHRVGKPHKCELCPKAFTCKASTPALNSRTTGFGTRGSGPSSVVSANRRFAGRAEQLNHERTHDGDRPYHCPVCKRSFGRNSILERHMMRHTGERPYKCHLCPNTFTRLYLLLEHCKDHPQPQSNMGYFFSESLSNGEIQIPGFNNMSLDRLAALADRISNTSYSAKLPVK